MGGYNGNPGFKAEQVYNVKVVSISDGESNNRGTPYIRFTFEVLDGEMEGESTHYDMYATEGRKDAVIRELAILGFDAKDPDAPWGSLKSDLVGKECAVTMVVNTWNNRTEIKVGGIRNKSFTNKPGGVLSKIAEMFGGQVRVAPGVAGQTEDGDVPF